MKRSNIDLSIIIVSYKGWNRLSVCLEALNSFTGNKYSTEVIVIDNRSDDDEIYKFEKKYPDFIFVHNKINGGFGNGCNLGSNYAVGEMLLFLNPDTVASENVLESLLVSAKNNPSYSILSCRQVNENGRESIAFGPFPQLDNLTGLQRAIFRKRTQLRLNDENGSDKGIVFPDWISGSVFMIRKDTFEMLGGFDDDFWMYYEDVDLCRRVRNNGGEIAFFRDITIEHNHGGSSRINTGITSLTKTEVLISRHIYIGKHKKGAEKTIIQIFLIVNNLISYGIMALLGLLFLFIPKVFVRILICIRLINYYIVALMRLSWLSPRSVNFQKTISGRL